MSFKNVYSRPPSNATAVRCTISTGCRAVGLADDRTRGPADAVVFGVVDAIAGDVDRNETRREPNEHPAQPLEVDAQAIDQRIRPSSVFAPTVPSAPSPWCVWNIRTAFASASSNLFGSPVGADLNPSTARRTRNAATRGSTTPTFKHLHRQLVPVASTLEGANSEAANRFACGLPFGEAVGRRDRCQAKKRDSWSRGNL